MQPVAALHLMKRAALPALCLLVTLYFGAHGLFGPTGLFARDEIREAREALLAEEAALAAARARLDRDIALLDPKGADPDYADQLVREHLGVVRPDEIIVPLRPSTDG